MPANAPAAYSFGVEPLSGALGAEILGLDLNAMSDETVAELRSAVAEYGVIYFRDQRLTPEQHIALGERFGPLDVNPMVESVPGYPPIYPFIRNPGDEGFLVGEGWHSDVTFYETPAIYSLLYCLETPAVGGDTCYSNQVRAYQALSPGLKRTLAGMRAIHTVAKTLSAAVSDEREESKLKTEEERKIPDPVSHPVLRVHPDNGKVALYVNSLYTERFDGWTAEESAPLLDYLCRHAGNPWFACRLRWEPGTLALWDNRLVQHTATGDYSGRRVMYRVTVLGEKPIAADPEAIGRETRA